ncbi:MAG TPA: DUF3109 family protein [Cyclobacteriaceae bacterium]|nr:DUF3109 family protein [Cyclobacteriaceae bacterium]
MIKIDNVILSDDIKEQFFVCDLEKCKGACCVEGEWGAPLEADELPILDEILEDVKPYLTKAGLKAIAKHGPYILDGDNEYSTTTIGGKECAFAYYDDRGILKCGIEKAHQEGKVDFKKPISCHLYPIRITKYDNYDAVNYHRWHICSPACTLGEALKVPLYVFLKDSLIRKYGRTWYNKLVKVIEQGSSDET